MRKSLYLAAAAFIFCHATKAQCPEKATYFASKLQMLDSTLNVTATKEVAATFATVGNSIIIHKSENAGDTMAGIVKKASCNWQQPFKNGKTIIVADILDGEHSLKDATITIEALDGKITILLHAAEHPNELIKLLVYKLEETPQQ